MTKYHQSMKQNYRFIAFRPQQYSHYQKSNNEKIPPIPISPDFNKDIAQQTFTFSK